MSRRRRDGFSLIEALVALTIASLMLGAIFELQLQMARGQRRAIAALDRVAAAENAFALTRTLNPMSAPLGEIQLPDGDTIRWESDAQGAPRRNAGLPYGDGSYEVQLFTVTVFVEPASSPPLAPLTFDRVGWRRIDGTDGTSAPSAF